MYRNERFIVISAFLVLIGCAAPAALAQVPVESGLAFWLDASRNSTIELSGDKVARWDDLSGNGYYADQSDEAVRPTYVSGALSGRAIVDFGDSLYGNPLTDYQPWMQFRNTSGNALNINTVRTVFWVCGMDEGTDGFMLGDDNNYHFHRGTANQIWDGANGWASANIRDGSTYLNGEEVDGTQTVVPTEFSIITLITTGNVETSMLARDRTYRSGGIKLGELLIYDRALTDDERIRVENYLYEKWFVPGASTGPQPADQETDVPRDTDLSWTPGQFAATHDVYFGTVFSDVNDASRTNPMGILVSQGQTSATYNLPGRLEFDQTYYWRVDEVNAPPTNTIYKGNVWSFTVEPFAYAVAIGDVNATSNTTSTTDQGPGNTVNGSGLNENDQHSTTNRDMWLGSPTAGETPYIQFEFDRIYKLYEMLVWNYNLDFEMWLGFGVKDATIEYSEDGVDWTSLGDVVLNQGPGTNTYIANTVIPMEGVAAQYVRLTIGSSYMSTTSHGLSEVRFMYIPAHARDPEPADGATDVPVDTVLSWRAGREAASHEVYLSTDPNDLVMVGTTTESRYSASLDLGATYAWQIVEVNEAEAVSSWAGDLWTFSTQPYIEIENFEAYNDDIDAGTTIWQTWIDGLDDPSNGGAVVGYGQSPFAEQTIIHGGSQSMPLTYSNSSASAFSETDRTFASAQNWTINGIKSLSLWFYGQADNGGQLYVKINGTKVLYNGDLGDIARVGWQPWNIDLSTVGGNLGSVTSLTIGVQGTGSGLLYVDDIRLYPIVPEGATPVEPDAANLVAHYEFSSGFEDSAGNYDGTAIGSAQVTNDPEQGSVLALDGFASAVAVPLIGEANEVTICMWAKSDVDLTGIQFASFFHSSGWEAGDVHFRYSYGYVNSGVNGVTPSGDLNGTGLVGPDQWNHVAITVSQTATALWLNGQVEASRVIEEGVPYTLGDGYIGAYLTTGGATERAFTGRLDDVRIYNSALSQQELAWLAGKTGVVYTPF